MGNSLYTITMRLQPTNCIYMKQHLNIWIQIIWMSVCLTTAPPLPLSLPLPRVCLSNRKKTAHLILTWAHMHVTHASNYGLEVTLMFSRFSSPNHEMISVSTPKLHHRGWDYLSSAWLAPGRTCIVIVWITSVWNKDYCLFLSLFTLNAQWNRSQKQNFGTETKQIYTILYSIQQDKEYSMLAAQWCFGSLLRSSGQKNWGKPHIF